MSIFGDILNKIFHHSTGTASAQPATSQGQGGGTQTRQSPTQVTTTAPPVQQKLSNVDVDAVLAKLASTKGGGGNWRTSIVDLLKLLDLDSSVNARKELARELNVHVGADGSAEQNIALQKAVMGKLAENGGKVPESLRH